MSEIQVDESTDNQLVESAIARWRQELMELAGGSALWDIDSLGDAVIDLTGAHPSGIAQLYAGRRTRLSYVVREGASLSQARRQARTVLARADELAAQFGVAPTYVAMGVAHWFKADNPHQPRSPLDYNPPEGRYVQVPVLLRPIRMTPVAANDVEMELDPQIEINPVLVRALRLHGVQVDPAILAASTNQEHGFTPRPALDAISALGSGLPEFSLESRIIVGTFVHPGQALADDLADQHQALVDHPVVRAIAGVEDDQQKISRTLPAARLADPDPDKERGIGDLDSVQHQILDTLASGSHLFIDTPPGVEVAPTVAAIVAEVAKNNSSMVYVPGTQRAGAALGEELQKLGAQDLALNLAADLQWRKTAAHWLVDGMNPPEPTQPDEVATTREELRKARKTLGDYIAALHVLREPWGVSANRVLHELADLTSQRPGPRTQVRLPSETVRSLSTEQQQQARTTLIEAAELGAFRLRASDTPWYGAILNDADHATRSLEQVRWLTETLPTVREQVAATAAQTGLDEAYCLAEWEEQLDVLNGISQSLDVFTAEVFERPAEDMVAATATKKWRVENNIQLPRSMVRRLRRQAKYLLRPGVVVENLHEALVEVAHQRDIWRKHCSGGGWPQVPENLTEITTAYTKVGQAIQDLEPVLGPTTGGKTLKTLPLADLEDKLKRLAQDEHTLKTIPSRVQALANLETLGLGLLIEDLSSRRVNTDIVGAEFDLAWWSSVLEEMLSEDPVMVALDPALLEEGLETFRRYDHDHVDSLLVPVLRAHAHHMREAIAQHRPEAQEFYRAVKQRGELDLRHLISTYPNVVWTPRPAWIVSPMMVPQVLPPNTTVDVVVIDAVHHLGVEYLLPAIVRAKQVVVVGDSRRLSEYMVKAFAHFPQLSLPTDRVDRATPLAEFLATHGYEDVIQPVPSPPQLETDVVSLDVVDGAGMPAPDSEVVESVQAEVDRVVDLVIDHALSRPDESLAVVALNARHEERIREAIAHMTHDSPALEKFFDPHTSEAFTVVNIDGVGGLRRDAVILTLGYGKTPHGRVLHRFGAVSASHGAHLMIDVVEAVRTRLKVVSSFSPQELDPARLRSHGANILYDLLLLAESGPQPIDADLAEQAQPDRLLVDLAERLWRRGITVFPQYGKPGWFRIPLALGHPSRPGELLMALLTDDAQYTTETSLRRRDRHWPTRLEQRGWQVRTVFSTAVFMDPQGEADRIAEEITRLGALEEPEPEETSPKLPAVVLDGAEDLLTQAEQDQGDAEPKTPASTQAPAPVRVSARSETIVGTQDSPTPQDPAARPDIQPGKPITGYSDDELDELIAWLGSDGTPRSVKHYVTRMREELGLTRQSTHVDTVLTAAIRRSQAPLLSEDDHGE